MTGQVGPQGDDASSQWGAWPHVRARRGRAWFALGGGGAVSPGLILGCIAVFAALLAAWRISRSSLLEGDSLALYVPLAQSVARGDVRALAHPLVQPVYPALVGATSRIFWWCTYPVELAGRAVSLVCFVALVLAVFSLARRLCGRRAAIAAAALTAVSPVVVPFSSRIGPETLFALIVVGVVRLAILAGQTRKMRHVVALYAVAALGGLVRTEGLLLLPLAVLALRVLNSHKRQAPAPPARAARLLAIVTVVLLAYGPRCLLVQRETGWFVPDIRIARLFMARGDVPEHYRDRQNGDAGPLAESIASTIHLPNHERNKGDTPWRNIDSTETILNLLLAGLVVIGLWDRARRRRLRREMLVVLMVCGCLLGIYLLLWVMQSVAFQSRQLVNVSGLLMPWAGAGILVLRGRRAASVGLVVIQRHPRLMRAQWFSPSWTVRGVLIALVVVMTSQVVKFKHRDHHREAGRFILRRQGAGARILAISGQATFYARGTHLPIPVYPIAPYLKPITLQQLCTICRQSRADYVIADATCQYWCPELEDFLQNSHSPPGLLAEFSYRPSRSGNRVLDVAQFLRSFPARE